MKKQATALLAAQLKHKSLELAAFHAIVTAIGAEPFELFLDTAEDKLLNPHSPEPSRLFLLRGNDLYDRPSMLLTKGA